MRKLYDLDPAEISLVPKGANKRKFLIFKREGDTPMNKELADLVSSTNPQTMKRVEKILKGWVAESPEPVERTINKDVEEGGEHEEGALSPQAQAALKAVVRILTPFKDQIDDALLDKVLGAAGFNMDNEEVEQAHHEDGDEDDGEGEEGDVHMNEAHKAHMGKAHMSEEGEEMHKDEAGAMHEGDGTKHEEGSITPDHHEEAHKMARDAYEKAYKSHIHKLGYRKYEDTQPQMKSEGHILSTHEDGPSNSVMKSASLKGVPSSVRPALEAIFKSNKQLVQKNFELEKALNTERRERRFKEFVQKAHSFKHYSGDRLELARNLMSLADTNQALYQNFESQLKTMDAEKEQIAKSGLFGEIGSSLPGSGYNDAESKINAAVDSIVQKSGGAVTKEQAYTNFLGTSEGQRLYGEWKSARKDGI